MIAEINYSPGVAFAAQQLMTEADRAHESGQVRVPLDYIKTHIDRTQEISDEVYQYIQKCYRFRKRIFL